MPCLSPNQYADRPKRLSLKKLRLSLNARTHSVKNFTVYYTTKVCAALDGNPHWPSPFD